MEEAGWVLGLKVTCGLPSALSQLLLVVANLGLYTLGCLRGTFPNVPMIFPRGRGVASVDLCDGSSSTSVEIKKFEILIFKKRHFPRRNFPRGKGWGFSRFVLQFTFQGSGVKKFETLIFKKLHFPMWTFPRKEGWEFSSDNSPYRGSQKKIIVEILIFKKRQKAPDSKGERWCENST